MRKLPSLEAKLPSLEAEAEAAHNATGFTVQTGSTQSGDAATPLDAQFARLEEKAALAAPEHESLDYEAVYKGGKLSMGQQQQKRRWFGYSGATLRRWLLTLFIGAAVGVIAFLMSWMIEEITFWKNEVTRPVLLVPARRRTVC